MVKKLKEMKTAEEFLKEKGYPSDHSITYEIAKLMEEYAQQNTLNRDKVMEIVTSYKINFYSGFKPDKMVDAICSLALPTLSENESYLVWQKVKTPHDLPPRGWRGAWKYSNSDEINNGNRDSLYDNAFLGESVEWLKQLTKLKEDSNGMKLIKDRPIEDPEKPQWDTDW